jgi:hypothetical protein
LNQCGLGYEPTIVVGSSVSTILIAMWSLFGRVQPIQRRVVTKMLAARFRIGTMPETDGC